MKTGIILAGGSGFIGSAIASALLARDHEVVVLTRGLSKRDGLLKYAHWDGKTIDDWAGLIDGAHALINLAGRSINCRHTPENRRAIIESRVDSVRVLGEAISRCAQPPPVFVQASAVGIYGDTGERVCDESCAPGDDFMADVCRAWEAEFNAVRAPATRKVLLRIGIALGPDGGFLKLLGKLTRLFLGGHVGRGRQFISWIHIVDLVQMFVAAIERDDLTGAFNATAPNPVTNAELMRQLRRALHRPWTPPVPKFAARIGSWLLGTEASLAFISQRCAPRRFLEHDFEFQFPEIRTALADIYGR